VGRRLCGVARPPAISPPGETSRTRLTYRQLSSGLGGSNLWERSVEYLMAKQIIVRTYKGSQAGAAQAFQKDAQRLAAQGYYPVSQNWAQGSWGCGAFIVAALLCVILIGLIVFIYLLIVKPAGTLTVTYEYRGP
jgi:hypothetical protein